MFNEKYGCCPVAESRNPYTCGLTGKTHTKAAFRQRTDHLARSIGKRMGWAPNDGTAWEKVMSIFSVNTVSKTVTWYLKERS
jgi:hypothetical protein